MNSPHGGACQCQWRALNEAPRLHRESPAATSNYVSAQSMVGLQEADRPKLPARQL